MTLLHGTGGITGKRPRANRLRPPESETGPLPSSPPLGSEEVKPQVGAHLGTDPERRDGADAPGRLRLRSRDRVRLRGAAELGETGDLRVDRELSLSRDDGRGVDVRDADRGESDVRERGPSESGSGESGIGRFDTRDLDLAVIHAVGERERDPAHGNGGPGPSAAALEATLLRLAAAGPAPADVLQLLVHEAANLLDAPARIALALDERLVWTAFSGDCAVQNGAAVVVDRTACGEAWRTGLIQNVVRPLGSAANTVISLDQLHPPDAVHPDPGPLTTDCCGSPAVLLAVPLLRERPAVPGRHLEFDREVFAVLALIGERPNWFDDDDIEATADLAEVAGERIAALVALGEAATVGARPAEPAQLPEPAQQLPGPARQLPEPGRPMASAPPAEPTPRTGEPDLAVERNPDPATVTDAVSVPVSASPPPAPSLTGLPAAAASITVVPVVRPGRGGFGGWFTRAPKTPPPSVIPAPRSASAEAFAAGWPADAPSATRLPVPSAGMVSIRTVRSRQGPDAIAALPTFAPVALPGALPSATPAKHDPADPETGAPEPDRDQPVPNELARTEPARTELARTELARTELARTEPARTEPARTEPARTEPARTEPARRRANSAEPVSGFGPTSRLPRARASLGTSMPAGMPAPDSMGLWQWDAISGECTWSSPVARLLGLAPEAELTLEKVRAAVAPADRGRFDVAVQAIGTGRGVAGALRLKTADGRAKHAYAWSEVRRDEAGKLLGAWGGVVDVTAFEHDAAALRSGLAGLRAAQELTGLATWEWRADAKQLIWSDEMYRLAGVPPETFEPTPQRWHAFVHPDDLERAYRLDLGADLDLGPGQDGERVETFRLIGPGGEIRHVQSWSATSGDRVVYGATIDVTRQVQDRVTLERLSATDPVTGLGNRLAFDRRMRQLLVDPSVVPRTPAPARSAATAPSVTLILLDLDRFKVVNDSLGHQVGDRLLIEVARRLTAVVPNGSVTARMGGDEFVVVPPVGVTELDVRRLAGGIVEALRAPYVLPETGELLICPASLGVARSEGRRVTGHDLLREADIALYRAKDSGRDRFVVFDEGLKARTLTRQRAERRLRTALEEDRLAMQFQPVVDFANGRVIGAEGLVRLYDCEGSPDSADRLIAPELFLDIAEQTGLVVEIDCWVIERAIEQLACWGGGAQAPGPWLAINLSARSMEHPRVIRRLIEAVKRGEVDRDRIKIELTEKSFIGSLPGVAAGVRQLIANGVGVGIDDFGTGYSALAYLQEFDLDFMKIDRSFVSSVGEGPRGDAVVTAIVDLAHAHGMRVIAEGVESGRQARRLREIGCDFAQGFHFGRPGEADRIMRG